MQQIVAAFVHGLLNFLFSRTVSVRGAPSREKIARDLARVGSNAFNRANYRTTDSFEYALSLAQDIMDDCGIEPTCELLGAVTECIEQLVISNAIFPANIDWATVDHEGDEGFRLRQYMERHNRFHANFEVSNKRFVMGIRAFLITLLEDIAYIPISENATSGFGVRMMDLLPDPQETIDTLVGLSFDNDLQSAGLYKDLNERFERNICQASGIDYNNQPSNSNRYMLPRDYSGATSNLVPTYLTGTPFKRLCETPLPFSIPEEVRFEHTHIVAGTGHGKTQLLSHMILGDLMELVNSKKLSLVLIDSQGDFIRRLSQLSLFDPDRANNIADRLVMIDPTDVDYPTALNIFAFNRERIESYDAAKQEQIFNGAVELYEHFFQGLLGADLTAKQGVAFSYMARMMLELPNASILTLRDLMDNPHAFKDLMHHLSGSTRIFFERELLSKTYNQTRKQISNRLWGIMAIPAFERMFGQTEHKVDLFELMNDGKVILINTSKAMLKKEGSAIFGKFFLAAIAQAIGERDAIPEAERTDTTIYLDEAHEYANESLEILLNQGRKYRAGVVIAHQYLDQLNVSVKQALQTNASTKLVGGLSSKDRETFKNEMDTDSAFLKGLQKLEAGTVFGLYIKNLLPTLKLHVPFGALNGIGQLGANAQQQLRIQNRERYCVPAQPIALPSPKHDPELDTDQDSAKSDNSKNSALEDIKSQPVIDPDKTDEITPETKSDDEQINADEIKQGGRGGEQHRDIQTMIKSIGHDFGYGAEVESKCQNSQGAIDVLLTGEKHVIAVEISVTTSPDHELANIRKCLAEPVTQVICVAADDQHRKLIHKRCVDALPQSQLKKLIFLNPTNVAAYLSKFDERETTLIRGYQVITQIAKSDPKDVEYRKSRIRRALEGK